MKFNQQLEQLLKTLSQFTDAEGKLMANAGHCATPSTSYLKDEAKMASNSLAMEVPSIISLVPEEII
jgi:hypothetical protein